MSAAPEQAPPRILVVDDNAVFRAMLEAWLVQEGYHVGLAGDGREGMRAIVRDEPDIVLSDWLMPHVDGLELCQALKTGLGDEAPYFILLTGKGEISDRLLGMDTGADDYLVKPCDMGELMARVRVGLKHVALARELRKARAALHIAETELGAARCERQPEAMVQCPECRRVAAGGEEWVALEGYVERVGLVRFAPRLCPSCQGAPAGSAAREGASARNTSA